MADPRDSGPAGSNQQLRTIAYKNSIISTPVLNRKIYEKLGRKPPSTGGGGSTGGGSGTSPGSTGGGTGTSPSGTATPQTNWSGLLSTAKQAAKDGVNAWAVQARLSGGKVAAVTASGGTLTSSVDFRATVASELESAGATENVAQNFAEGLWKAWKRWADGYFIPGLPWYPAFAAWPGPMAPPMPNVPSPLILGASAHVGELLAPTALAERIADEIGSSAMSEPGAQSFVDAFASSFSAGFGIWLASATWMSVMGSGPVPTFAPPYVPVGPVVNGEFNGNMGCLIGTINVI